MPLKPANPDSQAVEVVVQPAQEEVVEVQEKTLDTVRITGINIKTPLDGPEYVLLDYVVGYTDPESGVVVPVRAYRDVRVKDATLADVMTRMANGRLSIRSLIKQAAYDVLVLDGHAPAGDLE